MDKEDKTDRGKRYLERQRKELDKQREQLLKQIQERKEQSRISIQMEMRKTSTPKTKDTEKQIHKDTQIHIHNPVVLDSSKHKTGQSAMRKESEKMEESHVSMAHEMETHSQYLGSLDSDSLGYRAIDEGGSYCKDASEASYGIARLLADIEKYKSPTPVTNVLDTDIQPVSVPAILIKPRQTDISDMRQINTQTDVRKQTDKSPVAGVIDGDNMQGLTPAVPVSHKVVETDPNRGAGHVSYAQNEQNGQTSHNGTINDTWSLTHSMSGTHDDVHVIPLTHTASLQRSHDKTLDRSIERLRTSLRSLSKCVKDGSQISKTDIIEETDKDSKRNTLQQYDMTDTHSETDEPTKTESIKGNIMYKKDSEQVKLKDKEAYQDFIDIGKQMLEQAADRIEQQDDNNEDEEENLMQQRIEKLKLQARMIEEQNQRKAEEAKQMADRMRMFQSEQDRIEKTRKKMQRLKLLQEEEERMERHLQLQIKQQVEEEQRLKILKEEEERMKSALQQAKRVIQDSLRQETMRKQQVGHEYDLEQQHISRDKDDIFRQLQQKDRPNTVMAELTTGERPVYQIEREPVDQIEPTDMHQIPIEKLERELERISLLHEKLQYEQQKLDEKKSERIASEQIRMKESAEREEALLQKERQIKQLEEELDKRATAIKNSEKVKSKEEVLDEREAYLRHYEEELNTKENEIRRKLDLTPIKKSDETVNVQSATEKKEDLIDKKKPENETSCASFTHLFKPPYITRFSGTDPVPKTENTFEDTEVDCLIKRNEYPDYIVNQAVRNSLSGQARKVTFTLGAEATTCQIKEKLESVFGNVCSDESILQEFYTASQKAGESVTLWGIRIEEILQKAVQKGHAVTADQKDKMLKERFWRGLSSIELQNSTSVHYHASISFEMLRRKVRAEEYQVANRKTIKVINNESDRKVPQINTVLPESAQAQHQPIQVDPNIAKELKDLSKRMEALDRKINYRTSFNPRPYYPKGKGKEKGQGQSSDQNKKEESENKSKTDKAKEEKIEKKPPLN